MAEKQRQGIPRQLVIYLWREFYQTLQIYYLCSMIENCRVYYLRFKIIWILCGTSDSSLFFLKQFEIFSRLHLRSRATQLSNTSQTTRKAKCLPQEYKQEEWHHLRNHCPPLKWRWSRTYTLCLHSQKPAPTEGGIRRGGNIRWNQYNFRKERIVTFLNSWIDGLPCL